MNIECQIGADNGIRTHIHLIRNQILYPIKLYQPNDYYTILFWKDN